MNPRLLFVAAAIGCVGFSIAIARQNTPAPTPTSASTQPAPAAGESDDLRSVLEVFRSDLNASKIRVLNQVMKLNGPEAEKFWPIYRQYETDLAAVGDRKVALIREFVALQKSGGLNDKNAAVLAEKWFAVAQDRLDLWKKYYKQISAAVSPVRAAQFVQVEHQISLLIDINIAGEMPLIEQKGAETTTPAGKP
jgi:hypothetical protein